MSNYIKQVEVEQNGQTVTYDIGNSVIIPVYANMSDDTLSNFRTVVPDSIYISRNDFNHYFDSRSRLIQLKTQSGLVSIVYNISGAPPRIGLINNFNGKIYFVEYAQNSFVANRMLYTKVSNSETLLSKEVYDKIISLTEWKEEVQEILDSKLNNADWDAQIGEPGYIENKPFGDFSEYFTETYSNIGLQSSGGYYALTIKNIKTFYLKPNAQYEFQLNDEKYTATSTEIFNTSKIALNTSQLKDNGYNTCGAAGCRFNLIYDTKEQECTLYIISLNSPTVHNFTIILKDLEKNIKKIDKKYLPDEINNSIDLLYEDPTNGYDYIDMGEAGIWATCNVGANKPESFGLYFAWGETIGYSDNNSGKLFNWSDYKLSKGANSTIIKYCNNSSYGENGYTDYLTILEPEDDACVANMGGNWRIPTQENFQKLCDLCIIEKIQNYNESGVSGDLFTLKTDKSKQLFFPNTGYCSNGGKYSLYNIQYWTSNLDILNCTRAKKFTGNLAFVDSGRDIGYCIRGFIPTKSERYLTKKEAKETYYTKQEVDNKIEVEANVHPGQYEIIYTTIDNKKIEIRDGGEDDCFGKADGVNYGGDPWDGVLEHVVSNEYYPNKGYGIVKLKSDYLVHHLFAGQDTLETALVSGTFKSVGYYAFGHIDSLKKVEFEYGVEDFATEYTTPAGDWTASDAVFSHCINLEECIIPDSFKKFTGGTFWGCSRLKNFRIPKNITRIEGCMFWDCTNLSAIVIPSRVTYIGWRAFANIGISSLFIPKSVTEIESQAFQECHNLTYVEFEPSGGLNQNTTYTGELNGTFTGCYMLRELIVPQNCKKIYHVMPNTKNVERLVLPQNCNSDGSDPFLQYCGVKEFDNYLSKIVNWPRAEYLETLILRYNGVVKDLDTYATTFLVEDSEINNEIFASLENGIMVRTPLDTYIGTPKTWLKIYVPENQLKNYQTTYPKLVNHFHPITGEDIYALKKDVYTKPEVDELVESRSVNWEKGSGADSVQMKGCMARGKNSVAEGLKTIADGEGSHAEGLSFINPDEDGEDKRNAAYGNGSHVEGYGTEANSDYEHAEGVFNKSTGKQYGENFGNSKATLHSVGNGLNARLTHNAHEIKQDGTHYIPDIYAEGEYWQKPMINLQEKLKQLEDSSGKIDDLSDDANQLKNWKDTIINGTQGGNSTEAENKLYENVFTGLISVKRESLHVTCQGEYKSLKDGSISKTPIWEIPSYSEKTSDSPGYAGLITQSLVEEFRGGKLYLDDWINNLTSAYWYDEEYIYELSEELKLSVLSSSGKTFINSVFINWNNHYIECKLENIELWNGNLPNICTYVGPIIKNGDHIVKPIITISNFRMFTNDLSIKLRFEKIENPS